MMNLQRTLARISSLLPHRQVAIPCRLAPQMHLRVYLDSELSLPLALAEPETLRTFESHVSQGDVVFDVGAHIGLYSIVAAATSGTAVHSFEPHPANMDRLRDNVALNGLSERVQVTEAAVAESDVGTELAVGGNDTTHSVVNDGNDETICVETVTLDQYAERTNVQPDLVKVDVEGAGAEVVTGAERLLSEAVTTWVVEYHTDAERDAFVDVFDRYDYHIEHIEKRNMLVTPDS